MPRLPPQPIPEHLQIRLVGVDGTVTAGPQLTIFSSIISTLLDPKSTCRPGLPAADRPADMFVESTTRTIVFPSLTYGDMGWREAA